MTLDDLHQTLLKWQQLKFCGERPDPAKAYKKLAEEASELIAAVAAEDKENGICEVADVIVSCWRIAQYWGVTLEDCLNAKLPELMRRAERKAK